MNILSPNKPGTNLAANYQQDAVSEFEQPPKPILPISGDNILASRSPIATQLEPDAKIYSTTQVDAREADTVVAVAKAIATLSSSEKVEYVVASTLQNTTGSNLDRAADAVDYVFRDVVKHAGYGSVASRVACEIYKGRESRVNVACLVDYVNTLYLPVGGVVTTYPNRVDVVRACAATVVNKTFHVIGYRWRDQNAAGNPWSTASNGDPFDFNVDSYYNLAVRVRVAKQATLVGSDWALQFTHDPDEGWLDATASNFIAISRGPYDIGDTDPIPWPSSVWVASPGPGNYTSVAGIYAYDADQSGAVVAGNAGYVETEVIFRLHFLPDLPVRPYYFRLASLRDSVTISNFTASLNQPWVTNFT